MLTPNKLGDFMSVPILVKMNKKCNCECVHRRIHIHRCMWVLRLLPNLVLTGF